MLSHREGHLPTRDDSYRGKRLRLQRPCDWTVLGTQLLLNPDGELDQQQITKALSYQLDTDRQTGAAQSSMDDHGGMTGLIKGRAKVAMSQWHMLIRP